MTRRLAGPPRVACTRLPREPRAGGRTDAVEQVRGAHATAGDRHRAESIVRETLLRAGRDTDVFAVGYAAVPGWLMRVGYILTAEGYRARRAHPVEPVEMGDVGDDVNVNVGWDVYMGMGMGVGMVAAVGDGAVGRAGEILTTAQVRTALADLTAEHRAVLVEAYVHERTAVEAPSALGIQIGSVKSRTYFALRVPRLLLDEERERAR